TGRGRAGDHSRSHDLDVEQLAGLVCWQLGERHVVRHSSVIHEHAEIAGRRASDTASIPASVLRSATSGVTSQSGSERASVSKRSRLRATTTRSYPSAARGSAKAFPIPEDAPVTSARPVIAGSPH